MVIVPQIFPLEEVLKRWQWGVQETIRRGWWWQRQGSNPVVICIRKKRRKKWMQCVFCCWLSVSTPAQYKPGHSFQWCTIGRWWKKTEMLWKDRNWISGWCWLEHLMATVLLADTSRSKTDICKLSPTFLTSLECSFSFSL